MNAATARPGYGTVPDERLVCPDCGVTRRTAETLRVHRWLAHGLQQAVA